MEKRHMDTLNERFDRLLNENWTDIKEWEIKSWFGFERLRENAWRTLKLRWSERCTEQGIKPIPKLAVVQTPSGYLLAIWDKSSSLDEWC